MDSINKNQEEHNREDMSGGDAVSKIRELVEKAGTCFFCTHITVNHSEGARPMSVQKVDQNGDLWFLSASDSHKNVEIAADPSVRLYFQGSPHSDFLVLDGDASITTDRKIIEELWEPIIKTWFTGGIDDPRVTAIRVRPTSGYYWDTKHGNMVAGIKMVIGATIGKTMDDSIEGKVVP